MATSPMMFGCEVVMPVTCQPGRIFLARGFMPPPVALPRPKGSSYT
ncbi:hypothetical protein [Paludibaculum fermentans]